MQIDPVEAMLVIAAPAVAMVVGAAAGLWKQPGSQLRSGFQHLAAGTIFAAVAVELVPPLLAGLSWIAMVIGFALGVVVMLGIRTVAGERDSEVGTAGSRNPAGMVTVLGVDLFVDGLLVALALGAGDQGGVVLAVGISFETLFLGLAIACTLAARRGLLIGTAIATSLLLIAGGILGITLLDSLSDSWRLGMLAFGTAALLYLVTEELLVEAHEGNNDTNIATTLFFVGFGLTLAIAAVSG
ncbi:MAG: hypothetical protein QF471_04690 [Phycisphaerales bacterium]|jgi:ZIP family zinc transporter|nr:hypothetical protein [Phycisphaerales bacterium]